MNSNSALVYPVPTIKIDPARLLADLSSMEDQIWTHQNRYQPDIEHWDGISLYSVGGDMRDLRCADRLPVYKTPAGERCPYICNELLPSSVRRGSVWCTIGSKRERNRRTSRSGRKP